MSSLSKFTTLALSSLMLGGVIPIIVADSVTANIADVNEINPSFKLVDPSLYPVTMDKEVNGVNGIGHPLYKVEFRLNGENTDQGTSENVNASREWTIFVNQRPVMQVNDLSKAALTSAKLAILMNKPDFDPEQILPRVINDHYVVKYRDVDLITLHREDVENPSLQLTEWVNNLRVVAQVQPLSLVDAQTQMYQLVETGEHLNAIASWYGPYFHGRQTASGEYFEQNDFTAAHPSLPFDTYLKVTNDRNGKSVIVRINDRGPYFGDRSLDLSHAAAIALSSDDAGVVPVTATILAKL
ncbi:MAG: septal ring lytic transglycosylase RlpA family protein [Pseudanabaenaceae cyanobacterium bins.39]|nr:septal ring lytic transglycosylase RlpA family protein [Pseudanabaenaceae cyanobacterium bins.39]